MRMQVSLSALVISLASFPGMAQAKVRVMLRAPQSALDDASFNMVNVTFGLTNQQIKKIYEATAGRVDFQHFQSVDLSSRAQAGALLQHRGFDSVIAQNVPPPVFTSRIAADPMLDGQWWIEQLHVPEAWELATGSGVTIADCDAGYYVEESDLAGNFLMDQALDLSDQDDPTNVRDGNFTFHGTAVAAIMAGVKDGRGTNGIAYDAKIVPLQNFNYDPGKDDLDKEEATARCILHAIQVPGVDVIVLENQTADGSSETFGGTREAVKLALEAGITVVSAAGNASKELTKEMQSDTGSIIVGALNQQGGKAYFSNFGARVAIAAFGENLKTLYGPKGEMAAFGGTSGATPQVAATVALMLEVNRDLTPAQVKQILIATRLNTVGTATVGGLVNAEAAVRLAGQTHADTLTKTRQDQLKAQVVGILSAP